MQRDRILFLLGAMLVLLGALWLFDLPLSWPLAISALGGILLAAGARYRIGALALPGTILAGVGVLLFGVNLRSRWIDWLYLWPVLPALLGLGFILATRLGMPGRRLRRLGTVWLVEGLVLTALLGIGWWLLPTAVSWPTIVLGLGVLLLSAALFAEIAALAVPGTLFAGSGLLLIWQYATGLWSSWIYTWTLIPVLVGVGLVFANLLGMGRPTVRKVGLHMTGWGVVALLVLVFAFAFGELFARLWPFLLIVLGLWIVQSALSERAQKG